ncbi:MAG: hypothetical protein C4K48_10235 [Candidatus Thorarchaeota archaeon]|nr:MAG: hypothetical protein C4K48_10235 [Candidatus Thorarchaeota archaeon]
MVGINLLKQGTCIGKTKELSWLSADFQHIRGVRLLRGLGPFIDRFTELLQAIRFFHAFEPIRKQVIRAHLYRFNVEMTNWPVPL